MIPVILTERCAFFQGDSANIGSILKPNSVHAIVSDPPAGIGFMGKDWDKDKGGRDGWIQWLAKTIAASFIALKPGGYGLFWAIPKTSHWTALALELAGFEIVDRMSHFFMNGYPKNKDIARAIDMHVCTLPGRHCDKNWPRKRKPDDHFCPPASPELRAQWEGWGTGLKPTCEDWWLVRKPIEGTYAENVLAHGTGGLNIDATRIGESGSVRRCTDWDRGLDCQGHPGRCDAYGETNHGPIPPGFPDEMEEQGRWPRHVVLSHSEDCVAWWDKETQTEGIDCVDGCPVRVLDGQSGITVSRKGKPRASAEPGEGWGMTQTGTEHNDEGGASRFFYCPKPHRNEKELGLDHLPERSGGEATGRHDDSIGVKNPRAGAGRTGGAKNFHPTVKSIELMRYLCRLITPRGGIVLDPFTGSGSTGVGALQEGFSFVGVELGGDDGEYIPIAKARLEHALKEGSHG